MINKLLPQKELNPKFFDKNKHLNSEVREHLLHIALEFKKHLQLPETKLTEKVQVVDVRFTGSLANYNYSEYSDIDLHLVLDLSGVSPEELPLVTEYLQARKALWNENHEIEIFGYNVECYPEPYGQPHFATGVYSVTSDKWIVEPSYEVVTPDRELIKKKVTGFLSIVKRLGASDMTPDNMIKSIEILQTKIKKMRQAGLEEGGEFSTENLVFKILRRLGTLDELAELKKTILDKSISLES
jgi:hypothetical protein